MNEIALSNSLSQIELEINHHKQIAGQSIWEIGRRLKHVKENNLTHGEFGKWVEGLGIAKTEASRFIKIADEIPNLGTYTNNENQKQTPRSKKIEKIKRQGTGGRGRFSKYKG